VCAARNGVLSTDDPPFLETKRTFESGSAKSRLVYGLTFLVSAMRKSPVPWYLPLEHRFVWASRADGLDMDWCTAPGFVSALRVGLLGYGLSMRADWLAKPDVVLSIARAR
jgi:hypothetical protein